MSEIDDLIKILEAGDYDAFVSGYYHCYKMQGLLKRLPNKTLKIRCREYFKRHREDEEAKYKWKTVERHKEYKALCVPVIEAAYAKGKKFTEIVKLCGVAINEHLTAPQPGRRLTPDPTSNFAYYIGMQLADYVEQVIPGHRDKCKAEHAATMKLSINPFLNQLRDLHKDNPELVHERLAKFCEDLQGDVA